MSVEIRHMKLKEDGEFKSGQYSHFQELSELEEDVLKHNGIIVHYMCSEDGFFINCHTHGLESRNHKDFQIILPLAQNVTAEIFKILIDNIEEGKNYNNIINQNIDNIVTGMPIRLFEAKESGRDVLRIIVPDDIGLFPNDDGCQELYKLQAF